MDVEHTVGEPEPQIYVPDYYGSCLGLPPPCTALSMHGTNGGPIGGAS